METVTDFIFLGSKITVDRDCSHKIKRSLLLGKKAMTNLDSIFKKQRYHFADKVCKVKAMLSPVVMYGCDSWTIKKAVCCVLVAQLSPTLCDPMDCNPPASSVQEIFQARILEWVAISFSRGSSQPRIEPGSPALQANSLPTEKAECWRIDAFK